MQNISKTTKTILFASLIAAMILPFSMMDVSAAITKNVNEKAIEVAVVQGHVNDLYEAKLEKDRITSGESSSSFATEQAKTDRISQLDAIIQDKTQTLAAMEIKSKAKYALDPEFESVYAQARNLLRTTPDADNIPYLGMTLGDDRKSIEIGIDSLALTEEKDRKYYRNYIAERFADISYPVKVVFNERPENTDQACALRTSDCNPIIGGIYMENEHPLNEKCTVGLPIKK